jgi:hypothetical protein
MHGGYSSRVKDRFVEFFGSLRRFSGPETKINWVSCGNLKTYHRQHKHLEDFRNRLNGELHGLPTWVTFDDLSFDCTDDNIKDEYGHWTPSYTTVIGRRLVTRINKTIERGSCPRRDERVHSFVKREGSLAWSEVVRNETGTTCFVTVPQ